MKVLVFFVILLNLYSIESHKLLDEFREKLCGSQHTDEIYNKFLECEKLDPFYAYKELNFKCGFQNYLDELDFENKIKLKCQYEECYSKGLIEYNLTAIEYTKEDNEKRNKKAQDKLKCLFQVLEIKLPEM